MGHPKFTSGSAMAEGRFVIRRLVSMLTHYEDMNGDEKCKNWGGLGS